MYTSYEMLQMKERILKEVMERKMKVKDAAFLLGVSRRSISKWLFRYKYDGIDGITPKKPGPRSGKTHNRTCLEIEDLVIGIAKENPYKGPDWITDQLPMKLDQATVYRILKRRGTRYGPHYQHKRRKKKAYCLDTPGREIQVDVCFPFGYQRKAAVYDAIDDCSRFVYAKVLEGKTEKDTIEFLAGLIANMPFKVEAIRTDQGSEFSKEVTKFCLMNGIDHRKNPPYTPEHNGKIERYHRTFKENSACRWPFTASVEELNYLLSLWLMEYNFHKKHTGLGMQKMTPVQKIAYSLIANSFLPQNGNGMLQQNKI